VQCIEAFVSVGFMLVEIMRELYVSLFAGHLDQMSTSINRSTETRTVVSQLVLVGSSTYVYRDNILPLQLDDLV